MNKEEFTSKTILCYSFRKNVRIDLSCLPDDKFDIVIEGLSATGMCVEGSSYTGKYVKDGVKTTPFIEMINKRIAPTCNQIRGLVAFLNNLVDGEIFRIVSEDAPTMNKQLAVLKTKGLPKDVDEQKIHNDYLIRFGRLSTSYRHYAFGYDGLKTTVGEVDMKKRICRFCGKRVPEVSFGNDAHAISEGLGNKKLFCHEECNCCNNKLSKTESNLMKYLNVRRALGAIQSKSSGGVPSVDGKGFVIRGDENNKPVLYIEEESLPKNEDTSKPFWMKLEIVDTITNQGIYKSFCKIVIGLIPSSELSHFDQTIKWIMGSVMDNELPPYFASYDREQVLQPTVDVFVSNRPGQEFYCMAVVHVLDVLFAFALPEVDVDRARSKTDDAVRKHLVPLMNAYGGKWFLEDSSEYTLANPWVDWCVDPSDPQVCIRPKSDNVFMRYKKDEKDGIEEDFPEFSSGGISAPVISNVLFKRHLFEPLTFQDLSQVSVNYLCLDCILEKIDSSATFVIRLRLADSSNRIDYFDFGFTAKVRLNKFNDYIRIGDYFCFDYHLRDYLYELVFAASDKALRQHTEGTDLEAITMRKAVDPRVIRQLNYIVPVGDGKYMMVKDAQIHNY